MFSKITPQLARVLLLLSILFLLKVSSALSQSEKAEAGDTKGSTEKGSKESDFGKNDHTKIDMDPITVDPPERERPTREPSMPEREGGGNSDPSSNKSKSNSSTQKGKQVAKKTATKFTLKYLIRKVFGWRPTLHPIDYFYPDPMADDQKQDLLPVKSIEKLGSIYETLTPEEEAELNDHWEKAIGGDKKAAETLVKEIDDLYEKRTEIQKKSRSDEKNLVLPEPSRKRYRKLPDQP